MKWTYQKIILFPVFFLCVILLSAQNQETNKVTLSGYLTDATNGEALLYANVFIKNTNIGAVSYTHLTLPTNREV